MTAQNPKANQPPVQVESKVLDAAAVLAAAVGKEKARNGTDIELVESLESTILRMEATEGAWEKAAAAISTLASSRAESRMKAP
jgi:hypothetical protein